MNVFEVNNIIKSALKFNIREIDERKRFWMIRTKKGNFFNEFVANEFVALGWNEITKKTDFSESNIEILKKKIQHSHGDKRPQAAINKSQSFMFNIKEGDYLLIPNRGSSTIVLAKAGNYYEDHNYTVESELETTNYIENKESETINVKCPYIKRRKIEIIRTINSEKMAYPLKMAITNYHGLSNLDNYAEYILDCMYDCYSLHGDLHVSVNITKEGRLKSREISQLIYAITEYFCVLIDEESLSTKINLNSPGNIKLILEKGYEKIKNGRNAFIFLLLIVVGGQGLGLELPSITAVIKNFKTIDIEIQQKEIELEEEKANLTSKRLENVNEVIELMEKAEENNIDTRKMLEYLEIINGLDDSLKFKSNEIDETKKD